MFFVVTVVSLWFINLALLAVQTNQRKQSMTKDEIRNEVLDILADIAPDEDLSTLDDSKSFREQMEFDSMDFLDIVMELRKRHRVQIPEDDYVNLARMDSTVTFLEPLMKDMQRV